MLARRERARGRGLGGASIIDSFLPVPESTSSRGSELTTIPDSMIATVPGSDLRCVLPFESSRSGYRFGTGYSQADFLRAHKDDLLVVTCESSTVSHSSGQLRAVTGDGVHGGRTLLEATADRWGRGLLVPAANMAASNYAVGGRDPALPADAEQVTIADARYFALSTDGRRGVTGAPPPEQLARGRALREQLDRTSLFGRAFVESATLARYRRLHAQAEAMESSDLISRLLCSRDPRLAAHGLSASPYTEPLLEPFPAMGDDDFAAEAALAFLLARCDVSTAIAISPESAMRTVRDGAGRCETSTRSCAARWTWTTAGASSIPPRCADPRRRGWNGGRCAANVGLLGWLIRRARSCWSRTIPRSHWAWWTPSSSRASR